MTRVFGAYSSLPTAIGSAFLALLGITATGCGGTGERQIANLAAPIQADAGAAVDPCDAAATLETAQFGCTPSASVKCFDFEGMGEGALPTGWFRYYDKIAQAPKFADPLTGIMETFEANGIGDATNSTATTHGDWTSKMGTADKHCGMGTTAYHLVSADQNVWGPQFGTKFDKDTDSTHLAPVDVSAWDGIKFWVRKGTDHPELEPTGTTLYVGLVDKNTLTNSSKDDNDPPCNESSNYDSKKCDLFGASVGITTDLKQVSNVRVKCDPAGSGALVRLSAQEADDTTGPYYCWRHVMISFDEMRQRGFGVYVPELDRTGIKQVRFSMDIGDATNGNWNVWADDLMLYRRKN